LKRYAGQIKESISYDGWSKQTQASIQLCINQTSADTSFGKANFMFQGGVTKAQPGLGEGAHSDVQSTAEKCSTIQNGRS
jgi:hypothetical protein